jgi:hypothetical protein
MIGDLDTEPVLLGLAQKNIPVPTPTTRPSERRHPSPGTGSRDEIDHTTCPVRYHDRIRLGGDRRQELHPPCERRLPFQSTVRDGSNGVG